MKRCNCNGDSTDVTSWRVITQSPACSRPARSAHANLLLFVAGTHEELLGRCPEYANLVKRQLGGDRGSLASGLNLLARGRGSEGSELSALAGEAFLEGATGSEEAGEGQENTAEGSVVFGTSC